MSKGIMTNSIMNAAAGMMLLITGFLSSIVIARLLGPEANGVIAFVLWVAATGALVAELGTGVTLLRILPQLKVRGLDANRRRGFAAYLLHPVMAATVLLVAVYAGYFWNFGDGHWMSATPAVVLLTGILLFTQSIGSYTKNYYIGEQNLTAFSRITAVTSLIQLTGVVVGATFAGLQGALIGYIVAQIVPFAFAVRISLTRRDRCGIDDRYLVSSSIVLIFEFVVSAVFLTRPELFFLQHFQSVEAVGFYAVALSLSNIALQLPIQLTGSLLPFYAEQREQANGHMPLKMFEGVIRSLSYITLPMCFGLAAIATPLIVALYGEAFRPSGEIVAILSLGAPIFVFLQVCTQYLLSMDRARARLMVAIVGAVVMVAGCVVIIPLYGGAGAAIVRNGVFAVMCIFILRLMRLERTPVEMYGVVARVALAAAFCGLVAWLVTDAVEGVAGIGLAIAAGGIVYLATLRLLGAVPAQDALVLQSLAGSLPMRLRSGSRRVLAWIAPVARQTQPGE